MLATTLSLLIELEVLLDCCSMKDGKTDILDSRGGSFVLSGRSETELAPRDGVGRVMDNRGEDEEEEGEDFEVNANNVVLKPLSIFLLEVTPVLLLVVIVSLLLLLVLSLVTITLLLPSMSDVDFFFGMSLNVMYFLKAGSKFFRKYKNHLRLHV